jgi:hypothetical protein
MKKSIIIACCCMLLLSSPSFADIKFRLLFGTTPFDSKVMPEFSCLNDSNRQWFNCGLTKAGKPGEYTRGNLAAGSYVIMIGVDENKNNLKHMPGDWRADYRFNISAADDGQVVDVPMTKLIHLVKPQSNDGPMPGALGASCNMKPHFIPAGDPWTSELAIPFEWEPVMTGANYKVAVVRRNCEKDSDLGVFRRYETGDTSFAVTLPPSAENEYYAVFISGFKDGRFVGDLLTYDAGMQSWSYGFRVGEVSTPASYYLAAVSILLILALLWFVLAYAGIAMVLRIPVLAILIALLILGQKIIPDSKSYPPFKYFAVPPVFPVTPPAPANKPEQGQSNPPFAYSWSKEIHKPFWWKSVTPKRTIDSYSDLMLWWQSQDSSKKGQRELFKAIYEAIERHPEDEQLAVSGMSFSLYLSDNQQIRYQIGKLAIQHHLNHDQRTDNCANCSKGDTIAQIANSYAHILSASQSPKKAIAMLESVLEARGKDMSSYQEADIYITLVELLKRDKQTVKARKKLDFALEKFSGTNRVDRLKELDKTITK